MIRIVAALMLLLLVACESGPTPEPVVVYVDVEDEQQLRNWFADFTDDSGIPVTLKPGDSRANTTLVIANLGSPPADVLLTSNVADIWRAADEGALRPIQSESLSSIPPSLRDQDGLWAALNVRYAVIDVAPTVVANASTYAELADPRLRGQLCLSSSSLPVNRSLIAMMIQDIGPKPAERVVRGWILNLAHEPFSTEAQLQQAIQSGDCAYGILSKSGEIDSRGKSGEHQFYIDIDGVGVGRHARYPASAQRLIRWMFEQKGLTDPAWSNGKNIGIAGWLDEDAVLLAERAGYR